jgi:hypothetical protein
LNRHGGGSVVHDCFGLYLWRRNNVLSLFAHQKKAQSDWFLAACFERMWQTDSLMLFNGYNATACWVRAAADTYMCSAAFCDIQQR